MAATSELVKYASNEAAIQQVSRPLLFSSTIVAQMKGEAEAFAVEAKAKAEAEQMARKADAWKQYEDAAVVDMVLDMLPKVIPAVFTVFTVKYCLSN